MISTFMDVINDIYSESSIHTKVVFREALHSIELELEMLVFG